VTQVCKHTLAAPNHHHEPAPGVEILPVLAQMIGQLAYSRREQRDLNLRRACVTLMGGILDDYVSFDVFLERHSRDDLLFNRYATV
jgi:hypothetical protein